MRIYWLEQAESDVPVDNDWLSANELERLDRLRFAKRRTDWRLGRWTVKRAIAACLNWPSHSCILARIEVRTTVSGAPEAVVPNLPASFSISLSHSGRAAICAVAPFGVALGCDLEIIESRADAFVEDYFTQHERFLVSGAVPTERPAMVTLLWSAKESALKALHQGLRLDTRSVTVDTKLGVPDLSGWSPLRVCQVDGTTFYGWWRTSKHMVYTMVANPMPACPICLGEGEGPRPTELCVDLRIGMHVTTEVFSMARQ
jgi:4'-phosphopantetheinyl transferase